MASGDAKSDLLWLVLVLIGLGFVWVALGGPERGVEGGPFLRAPYLSMGGMMLPQAGSGAPAYFSSPNSGDPASSSLQSSYSGLVQIGRGNAASEYRPGYEYITLSSRADEPITITNWQLVNGRANRFYSNRGEIVPGTPDIAVIPYGRQLFVGGANNAVFEPIVLPPRGQAVVITGMLPERNPYPINTSFRVNKCSGYLGELKQYRDKFEPSLPASCPVPEQEVDLRFFDDDCYGFIRSLGRCELPEEKEIDDVTYFGGEPDVPRACREFVQTHFNYNACVGRHQNDPDFFRDEWRVYLGRTWELWDERREEITLYDQFGRIVDELSY